MRTQMVNRRASNLMTDVLPPIGVTGLYEDLESGIRAKVLIECVQANMDLSARFTLDLWRFDWVGEEPLRNMALSAAKSSTLVIMSISRAKQLPPGVEDWMTAWGQDSGKHLSALMALLPKQRNFRRRRDFLRERLQSVAQQKGATFFCEYFDAPVVHVHREVCREQTPVFRQIAVWQEQPAERSRFTVPVGRAANRIGRLGQNVHRL